MLNIWVGSSPSPSDTSRSSLAYPSSVHEHSGRPTGAHSRLEHKNPPCANLGLARFEQRPAALDNVFGEDEAVRGGISGVDEQLGDAAEDCRKLRLVQRVTTGRRGR